jgi:MaoC dehydratase-like protein
MIEWFDDLALGMRFTSSEKVITREDIKRFASEFDPQPYHLDEAAAERTPLKGLAASGWHTAAVANAVGCGGRSIRTTSLVGPWRRRIALASPGTAWRCPPPRRRGNRTHPIKNKAARNRSDQMDSFQSTWRVRVHVYSDRHRAASVDLIDCSVASRWCGSKTLLGEAQERKKAIKYERIDAAVRQQVIGQEPAVKKYHARWEEHDNCPFDCRKPTQKSGRALAS